MRERGADRNDLLDRLAADERLGFDRAGLDALLASPLGFTGAATDQVAEVVRRVDQIAAAHPDAAAYTPPPIL